MTYKKALEVFNSEIPYSEDVEIEALYTAIQALREAEARENPQPLKLEELRERNGKPVYVIPGHGSPLWVLINLDDDNRPNGIDNESGFWDGDFYNMQDSYYKENIYTEKLHVLGWVAYDFPPKEATC